MAAKRGLQQRMREEIRKRREKQRPQAVPTHNVRSDRWDEITRSHEDVLQNIEATLVACAAENENIDDATLHVALVAAMRDDPPGHPMPWEVFSALKRVRSLREDVSAELWLDALRVVDQSVRDHSSLRRGEVSYLTFILPFVASAFGDETPDYEIIEGRISPPTSSDEP